MKERDFMDLLIRVCFLIVFYLGLSFVVLLAVVFRRGFYVDGRCYLSGMIDGTAWRPFVFRVLVPKAVYITAHLTPEDAKSSIVRMVKTLTKRHHEVLLGRNTERRFEYLLVIGWITLALALSAVVWKSILCEVMKYPEYVCFLIPVFGILGVGPILLLYGPYIYDTTTILLFSLAIRALLVGNRVLYYSVFLLSILNKETSLLMPLLFGVAFYHATMRRQLAMEIVLQVFLWGIWRYFLITSYSGNQGVNMEFHLFDYNLPFFTYFSLKHVRFWLIIGGVALLVGCRWRSKPVLLRRLFIVACFFLLPLHALFAWIDEFRGLLEIYPIAFLLGTSTLLQALGYRSFDNQLVQGAQQKETSHEL